MKYEDLKYLAVPLPEAIEKEKWGGFFENARSRIAAYLQDEATDYALRCRLELELGILQNLEERYTVCPEEALKILQERIPKMTAQELEQLRMEDKADWIYVNGQVRYLDSFASTLYKVYPQIWSRTEAGDTSDYRLIEDYLHSCRDGVSRTAHIHIRHEVEIAPRALREGRPIRVHIPIPRERDGITNFELLQCSPQPDFISGGHEAQPTAYFEETAAKGQIFSLEYAFDYTVPYHDLSRILQEDGSRAAEARHTPKASEAALPQHTPGVPEGRAEDAFCREDLQEEAPHIVFTPHLVTICGEIVGDETEPLHKARKIYDFVTTGTDYRFVRDYASIDNLTEYCALNRRGDCGIQSLLFITLCRIAGIPAQWESGLEASPSYVGEHDWAKFFIAGLGWLHADLAGGALAYARKALDRWNFFFGNVDPYRIPINNRFQHDFHPPKQQRRLDPYDNQCGEIEYEDSGVYGDDLIYRHIPIDIHLK